jgi:hypothetical protein
MRWPSSGWSALLPALAGFLLGVYLFYPGFMAWDSTAQYFQVVTGEVENPHPPIMVYLWMLTNRLVPGPGGLFLVHLAGYWGGIALISAHLVRRPAARAALILALGLFPPLFELIPVVWKDSGALASLLLCTGLILHARRRRSRAAAGGALGLAAYAAAVRSLGTLTTLPLLWTIAGSLVGSAAGRRRRLALFAAFAAGISLFVVVVGNVGVKRLPYRAAVPLWDLAILSLEEGELLIPDYAIHVEGFDLARLRKITRRYRCNFHDPDDGWNPTRDLHYWYLDPADANRLLLHWMATILRYPGSYLRHRARITRRLLDSRPAPFVDHRMVSIPWYQLPFRFERRPGYGWLWRRFQQASRTPLCRPWPYGLLACAVLAGSLLVADRDARLARAVAASGILSVAALPVAAPSTDFRYSIWLVASSLVAALLLARGLANRLRDEREARPSKEAGDSRPTRSEPQASEAPEPER